MGKGKSTYLNSLISGNPDYPLRTCEDFTSCTTKVEQYIPKSGDSQLVQGIKFFDCPGLFAADISLKMWYYLYWLCAL